jgi:hypothetical protein
MNKITISIDWNSPDKGFSKLKTPRVIQFVLKNILLGNNLIQTQPGHNFHVKGKTTLKLQAIKVKSWPITPNWDDDNKDKNFLQCKKFNKWIKTTPCGVGKKRAKLFVKMKCNSKVAGFTTYLWRIISGEIDQEMHKQFVNAMKHTFRNKPIYIDNKDVNWFHMKERV